MIKSITKRYSYALILSIQLIFSGNVNLMGQSSFCTNSGFEMGNFSNWTGSTGNCCPVNTSFNGIVSGQHTIMTGNGKDPFTNNVVPVVFPGNAHSARLGNSNAGAQAEKLSYSFLVTPQTSLFVYRYAVVLEDPGHSPSDQPRFAINVFNQNNLPVTCGAYNVVASAGIPGFISTNAGGSDVVYKDWSAVGIDLSGQLGQTITIEFTTADCGLGGHFGYAYISAYCSPLTVESYYCIGNYSAILQAPDGFQSYLWSTGDTTQSLFINNPVNGTTYQCEVTSFTGCKVTLSTILAPTIVNPSIGNSIVCLDYVGFIDSSVVTNSSITRWNWNFGDGTTDTVQHPTHTYSSKGTYNAALTVTTTGGCTATASKQIVLADLPEADFTTTNLCEKQAAAFNNSSFIPTGVNITGWQWIFNNTDTSDLQNTQFMFNQAGNYPIVLTITSSDGCIDSILKRVTVHEKPIADFSISNKCLFSPIILSDLSMSNDNVVSWNWFADGKNFSSQQNNVYEFTLPGNHNISLSIETEYGCTADTTISLNLLDTLDAKFTYQPYDISTAMPVVNFANHSVSNISYFKWNFGDGSTSVASFNPIHRYETFGNYPVSLIVENNIGCTDTAEALLEVKPNISLYVPNAFTPGNDSFNDYFFPKGEIIKNYVIRIYNRWGQNVFSGSINQPWDGWYKGKIIEPGNYIYQISGEDYFAKNFEVNGCVAVLK